MSRRCGCGAILDSHTKGRVCRRCRLAPYKMEVGLARRVVVPFLVAEIRKTKGI